MQVQNLDKAQNLFQGDSAMLYHLIAGYVKTVAALFEMAPTTKAEKADKAAGEGPAVEDTVLFLCFLNSLCFS